MSVVGGSQVAKIADKMEEIGGDVVGVWKRHRIVGVLTREKIEQIRVELVESDIAPDCIVVGGALEQYDTAWALQPTWFRARETDCPKGGGERRSAQAGVPPD